MEKDLTQGKISSSLWKFALPLMAGNILQQFYNLTDTWIVGRYIGPEALAAVGSSYSLMTFLNSILTGLSMGSAAFFFIEFGRKNFPDCAAGQSQLYTQWRNNEWTRLAFRQSGYSVHSLCISSEQRMRMEHLTSALLLGSDFHLTAARTL